MTLQRDQQNLWEMPWNLVSVSNNGILTYSKSVPGTNLLAFKGVFEIDMHISNVIGLFLNLSRSSEWIDMLGEMKMYPVLPSQEGYIKCIKRSNGTLVSNNTVPTSPVHKVKTFFKNLKHKLFQFSGDSSHALGDSNGNSNHSVHKFKKSKNNRNAADKTCKGSVDAFGFPTNVPLDKIDYGDVLYQVFLLPWPLKQRDIILQRRFCFNEYEKSVTVAYKSVEDDRIPLSNSMVRAESPHTLWRFQDSSMMTEEFRTILADAQGRSSKRGTKRCAYNRHFSTSDPNRRCTVIEIECLIDSKSFVPTWFLNYIQAQWPSKSLSRYENILKKKSSNFELISHW